jgi:signal transduction histidine kinase
MTVPPRMNPSGFASFGRTTCTISVALSDGVFGCSVVIRLISTRHHQSLQTWHGRWRIEIRQSSIDEKKNAAVDEQKVRRVKEARENAARPDKNTGTRRLHGSFLAVSPKLLRTRRARPVLFRRAPQHPRLNRTLLRNLFPRRWPFGSGAAAGTIPIRAATDPNVEARLRQQAALVYLSRKTHSAADAGTLLADICRVAARVLRADLAHALELLPDGRTLVARAASGWAPDHLARWQMEVGPESRLGEVLRTGGLLLAGDADEGVEMEAAADVLDAVQMRSGVLIVAREAAGSRVLFGVYSIVPRRFSRDELQFVRAVAALVEAAFQHEEQASAARAARRRTAAAQADMLRLVVARLRPALRESVGHLWTFREERPDTFTLRRAVRDTERQVASVADFIEDLWLLADLLDGRVPDRRVTAVGPLLSSLTDQLAVRAAAADITLTAAIADPNPVIVADPVLVRRAVFNILDNALRFTGPGGSIAVSAAVEPGCLVIEIADTGRGMTAAQIDRLNGGVDHGATQEEVAARIGWRLANAILEAHQGRVSAASDGPGLGSRITLRLPHPDLTAQD